MDLLIMTLVSNESFGHVRIFLSFIQNNVDGVTNAAQ